MLGNIRDTARQLGEQLRRTAADGAGLEDRPSREAVAICGLAGSRGPRAWRYRAWSRPSSAGKGCR